MTQVKSVNLDELSSVYPITGKVKNIILNINTMLEAEGSKIQNGSCQQMNNHLSSGAQACSPLTLVQGEQQEDR